MTKFSPAKLNLFLHITGRRVDGYHDLQSVFCLLDFGDCLRFELTSSAQLVTLKGADGLTKNPADNLITKAVHALAERFPAHARAVTIHLDKHIPTGAGLGGGSSNCATTLMAVNELWGLGLSAGELIDIGATLGADVPFFIFAQMHQSHAIVEGIGERLTKITLEACEFLLLMPNAHISTAHFFAKDSLKRDCVSYPHDVLRAVDFYYLPSEFGNVFEPIAVASSPQVAQALTYLQGLQPITQTTARMTGTGSVVFLPLLGVDDETKARFVKNAPCSAKVVSLWRF